MNIFSIRTIIILVLLSTFSVAMYGQNTQLRDDLGTSFSSFDIVQISQKRSFGATHTYAVNGDRRFSLELTPHDLRSSIWSGQNTYEGEIQEIVRAPISTFKGVIQGKLGSSARLSFVGSVAEGFISVDGITYFVEPARRYSEFASEDDYVLYKIEDAVRTNSFSCGSQLGDKIERIGSAADLDRVNNLTGANQIDLATEADFEYVATLGGIPQANQEILGILNTIEGLYATELNLSFNVVYQHTWTSADPFAGANAEHTVRNFQAYWNVNHSQLSNPRDATHLFSGKANVLSQGWAFIGVMCRRGDESYGMSGYVNWAPAKYLITAHEMAHNLGANHVDTAQSCSNTLMNSQLSGDTPLSFCQYSRQEITSFVTANGSCITPGVRCSNDMDGDGKADIGIFRPNGASGAEWWFQRSFDGSIGAVQFGSSLDTLTPADYTGDGKTDIAFFRPSTGFWYMLRSDDFSFYAFPFGTNGDVPTPADFDADGRADVGVFRASTGTWFVNLSSGSTEISGFGAPGDKPVASDYDGDGKADLAVFRTGGGVGEWWIKRSTDQTVRAAQFGSATDKAVQGDFTGDGKADIALWRPSNGNWYILRSEDGSFYAFPFGAAGDVPVPGDYDGDGRADAAIFRPGSSTWYASRSTAGTLIQQFGQTGDIPIESAYVR